MKGKHGLTLTFDFQFLTAERSPKNTFYIYTHFTFPNIHLRTTNLQRFMVKHWIDSFNLMSNFFVQNRNLIQKFWFIFYSNWIENDNFIALSIHFKNFPRIYQFSTISTSKSIIYCLNRMVFWWFYLDQLHANPWIPVHKGSVGKCAYLKNSA